VCIVCIDKLEENFILKEGCGTNYIARVWQEGQYTYVGQILDFVLQGQEKSTRFKSGKFVNL